MSMLFQHVTTGAAAGPWTSGAGPAARRRGGCRAGRLRLRRTTRIIRWSSAMEYWPPASALVIVAHPDDIEFGCAGTVARWVSEGARVTYALLTNGAAGSSDPAMTRARLAELRESEQRAAA